MTDEVDVVVTFSVLEGRERDETIDKGDVGSATNPEDFT